MTATTVRSGLLGGRVPCVTTGSGPTKAVVFLGANALFKRLDRSDPRRHAGTFARLFGPGYTVHLLGYRDDPPDGYDVDAIVDEFAAVVRQEFGPVILMGVSFGGFVATRFAAAHPDLVERLVLLVSALRFSDRGQRLVVDQLAYLREGNLYGLVRDNAALFRRPWLNGLVRLKLWKDRRTLSSTLNDPRVLARTYGGLVALDPERTRSDLRAIRAPTLVIGGTADQYFDASGFAETAELIPSGKLRIFPGETHMLPAERTSDVARELALFLGAAGKHHRGEPR